MPKLDSELSAAPGGAELCVDCEHPMSLHDEDGACMQELCMCGVDDDDDDEDEEDDEDEFDEEDEDDEFEEDDEDDDE